MLKQLGKIGALGLMTLLLSACVTTTNSPLAKKKDLDKAELTYVQIGYSHIRERNYQDAKQAFQKALDLNKRSPGAFMGLGIVYAYEEEEGLAKRNFHQAIRYDETPESRFQYAVWRYNVQDFSGALRELKRVVEDPAYIKRAEAYDIYGLTALRLEKTDEAINAFRRAITLNRQLISPYINLANTYLVENQPDKGYETYKGFVNLVRIELARQSPATLWLGIRLAHLNKDQAMVDQWGRALQNEFPASNETKAYKAWKEQRS